METVNNLNAEQKRYPVHVFTDWFATGSVTDAGDLQVLSDFIADAKDKPGFEQAQIPPTAIEAGRQRSGVPRNSMISSVMEALGIRGWTALRLAKHIVRQAGNGTGSATPRPHRQTQAERDSRILGHLDPLERAIDFYLGPQGLGLPMLLWELHDAIGGLREKGLLRSDKDVACLQQWLARLIKTINRVEGLPATEGGPMTDKQRGAAEKQLTIALGIDHEELLQKVALRRMFNAAASDRIVQHNAWLQGLELQLPELAAAVQVLYPCNGSEDREKPYPCSLCVITSHDWDSDADFVQVEAECKAIAEGLAELLAVVPGPIERVDVVPECHDSNLAEVAVRRNGERLGGAQ